MNNASKVIKLELIIASMDKILPSEILIKIFMYLSVDDIQSVSDTCIHWKNIIENYNIWEAHWVQLVQTARKTNLNDKSYLKQLKICDINLKYSCIRLKNVLYNEHNQVFSCLRDNSVKTFDFGILKTHYSKVTLALYKTNSSSQRNLNYVKNDALPTSKSYMQFRSPPKLLEALNAIFRVRSCGGHRHVRRLVFVYPLGVSPQMEAVMSCLLGAHHAHELVLVPRVLALCEGLGVSDALVVYSTSRSTEVALVCGGRVAPGRWVELPVGGWQVAQHLHDTFTWLHPDAPADPQRFDDPSVKALCWLRMPHHVQYHKKNISVHVQRNNQSFVLKDEQYLATELMYCELGLCEVVSRLARGLGDEQLGRCLSHVLLAGGNCRLRHLGARLRLELAQHWPQHALVLTTSVHTLAGYTPPPGPLELTHTFTSGQTCCVTRELYIRASR